MNHSMPVIRSPRRVWALPARTAVATVAIAGLALPAPVFGAGESTNSQKALAYSRCIRSHGVPNFPDPNSSGELPKISQQQLDNPLFQAAERACQDLLPAGTDDQFPPGEVQQLLLGMVRFSACMRSHGVPDWPDPTTDVQGRPIFPLPAAGISRQQARSPRVTRAGEECQHLLPAALPGIPIG